MAHGFSAVKEMFLDDLAEAVRRRGAGALVFDNRNFGASDGEPRREIDPWAQVRLPACDHLRPDPPGGRRRPHRRVGDQLQRRPVLVLGAIDKRIKCVVAQVTLVSGFRNIQRLVCQDFLAPNRAAFDQDRAARYRGEPPAMVQWWTGPAGHLGAADPDSWEWFLEAGKGRAPSWKNEVTLRGVEMLMEYESSAYLERVAGPLLMVVAALDHLTPSDLAMEAYQQARRPKRLVLPTPTSTPTSSFRRRQRRDPRLVPGTPVQVGVGLSVVVAWRGTVRLEEVELDGVGR